MLVLCPSQTNVTTHLSCVRWSPGRLPCALLVCWLFTCVPFVPVFNGVFVFVVPSLSPVTAEKEDASI